MCCPKKEIITDRSKINILKDKIRRELNNIVSDFIQPLSHKERLGDWIKVTINFNDNVSVSIDSQISNEGKYIFTEELVKQLTIYKKHILKNKLIMDDDYEFTIDF